MIIYLLGWFVRIFGMLGILLFLYLNVCLYDEAKCSSVTIEADLMGQLQFLKRSLHENHAGTSAQALYSADVDTLENKQNRGLKSPVIPATFAANPPIYPP